MKRRLIVFGLPGLLMCLCYQAGLCALLYRGANSEANPIPESVAVGFVAGAPLVMFVVLFVLWYLFARSEDSSGHLDFHRVVTSISGWFSIIALCGGSIALLVMLDGDPIFLFFPGIVVLVAVIAIMMIAIDPREKERGDRTMLGLLLALLTMGRSSDDYPPDMME
jgi:predicted membrane channel-forming protein YqfA (hemolysin III family)